MHKEPAVSRGVCRRRGVSEGERARRGWRRCKPPSARRPLSAVLYQVLIYLPKNKTGFIVKHGDTLTEPPPMKSLKAVEEAAKRAAARKKKAAA